MSNYLNFYPGPSKLYPAVKSYMEDAYNSGILSKNHRSQDFMDLMQETITALKNHLNVPETYEAYFVSSATECWEICVQSLISGSTQFIYNGAFGKKWFKYAVCNPQKNNTHDDLLRGSRYFLNESIKTVQITENIENICWASNETSNGSITNEADIAYIRKSNPESMIMIDATSSLGGVAHEISNADVWFASVQKCFGMPSGLAMMIVSPRALSKMKKINERNHYNSLSFISENFNKYQTHTTPNILGIYCLYKSLQSIDNVNLISKKLNERAQYLYSELSKINGLELTITEPKVQSPTVISLSSVNTSKIISDLKSKDIIVGKGYGEWLNSSFRIANFPAIDDQEYEILLKYLKNK